MFGIYLKHWVILIKFLNKVQFEVVELMVFNIPGYSKHCKEIQELYEKYVDSSSNNSLIVCLIRYFSEILNEVQKSKKSYEDKKNLYSTTASQTCEKYLSLDKEVITSEQKIPNESSNEVSKL